MRRIENCIPELEKALKTSLSEAQNSGIKALESYHSHFPDYSFL